MHNDQARQPRRTGLRHRPCHVLLSVLLSSYDNPITYASPPRPPNLLPNNLLLLRPSLFTVYLLSPAMPALACFHFDFWVTEPRKAMNLLNGRE